eukprot:gene10609-biopygen19821
MWTASLPSPVLVAFPAWRRHPPHLPAARDGQLCVQVGCWCPGRVRAVRLVFSRLPTAHGEPPESVDEAVLCAMGCLPGVSFVGSSQECYCLHVIGNLTFPLAERPAATKQVGIDLMRVLMASTKSRPAGSARTVSKQGEGDYPTWVSLTQMYRVTCPRHARAMPAPPKPKDCLQPTPRPGPQ